MRKKMQKQEVINNTSQNADDSWFDVSEGLDKLDSTHQRMAD